MGERIRLTSGRDGFSFEAWHTPAQDARRGGLIILHAIWGVTPHLRALAEGFAAGGYEVLIPSLLDRTDPGFPERDTDPALRARRLEVSAAAPDEQVMSDVAAARDALEGPVFTIGFCWGGRAAWLAAARVPGLAGVAAFYPTHIGGVADEAPLCPTVLHFGRTDPLIPLADVERVVAAHPDLPVWLYDAGHAFVAPGGDHREDAARLALLRTRQLFHRTAGKGEMGG